MPIPEMGGDRTGSKSPGAPSRDEFIFVDGNDPSCLLRAHPNPALTHFISTFSPDEGFPSAHGLPRRSALFFRCFARPMTDSPLASPPRSLPAVRFVAGLVLALGLLVGIPTDARAQSPLELTEQQSLDAPALDVLVHHNHYDPYFGDQKLTGIELIHHDARTVTNDDVRLSNTPEQWDDMPVVRGEEPHVVAKRSMSLRSPLTSTLALSRGKNRLSSRTESLFGFSHVAVYSRHRMNAMPACSHRLGVGICPGQMAKVELTGSSEHD